MLDTIRVQTNAMNARTAIINNEAKALVLAKEFRLKTIVPEAQTLPDFANHYFLK